MKYTVRGEHIDTDNPLDDSIKVGDNVTPKDGSYALVLRDGELKEDSVAYAPKRQVWRVVALGGKFPTGLGALNTLPGQPFKLPAPHNEIHKFNDVMMVQVHNPSIICFIREEFLRRV